MNLRFNKIFSFWLTLTAGFCFCLGYYLAFYEDMNLPGLYGKLQQVSSSHSSLIIEGTSGALTTWSIVLIAGYLGLLGIDKLATFRLERKHSGRKR